MEYIYRTKTLSVVLLWHQIMHLGAVEITAYGAAWRDVLQAEFSVDLRV
jgi:hypothetical protein